MIIRNLEAAKRNRNCRREIVKTLTWKATDAKGVWFSLLSFFFSRILSLLVSLSHTHTLSVSLCIPTNDNRLPSAHCATFLISRWMHLESVAQPLYARLRDAAFGITSRVINSCRERARARARSASQRETAWCTVPGEGTLVSSSSFYVRVRTERKRSRL